MNEESDGMNDNEINNSEVVILPERSHVEELLLSDQSQIREEQNAYERKLDEKLKDLGLYEDDMTIIQKEELLAVVVISCETAEQEENKRQLIREYLEGAQSLEEEIEFSFQESAWLASEANLLCSSTVTRPKDEDDSPPSSSKMYTSFLDGESSTSRKTSNVFDSVDCNESSAPPNSPDIYDDEAVYAEISADPQTSTSEINPKKSAFGRSRSRSATKECHTPETNLKIDLSPHMLQEHNLKETEHSEILDRQDQKELLDKSMACWKPCMSPKYMPLSNFRLKKEDENDMCMTSLQEKFTKYLNCFNKIASLKSKALKSKRCPVPKVVVLNKPYVIMHHGNVAKKTSKLDDYDYTVGVSDKGQSNEEEERKFMACNTVTRAKSAFHRVKPISHGRLFSTGDQNAQDDGHSVKTTRSGATYGSKRLKSEVVKPETSAQVDNSCNQSQTEALSQKFPNIDGDSFDDTARRLPKFSDMKPDIGACKMIVPSFVSPGEKSQANATVKYNCDSHSGILERRLKRGEKFSSKPEKDYSSDSSSSLIDVETVVDEEIEEFVLKRKIPPISQRSNYLKSTTQSKRLKKSDL